MLPVVFFAARTVHAAVDFFHKLRSTHRRSCKTARMLPPPRRSLSGMCIGLRYAASAEQRGNFSAEHYISVLIVNDRGLSDLGIARCGYKYHVRDHSVSHMLMNINMRLDSVRSADNDGHMAEMHCAAARRVGRLAALEYKPCHAEGADRADGSRYSARHRVCGDGVRLCIRCELTRAERTERKHEL